MKSQGDSPRNYHPSNRSVLERHRDVMKELLSNHRVSIRTASKDDDDLCTCYQQKRSCDDVMLHGKMVSCVPDFQSKFSSVYPKDFLFHCRLLSGCIVDGSVELATEWTNRLNDEDIFFDCCSKDEDEKSALTSLLKTTQAWPEVAFVFGQLLASASNTRILVLKGLTNTRCLARYSLSPQSMIASEDLLKSHVRSSSVVDDNSHDDAPQEGGISLSPVEVQASEICHERIPQEREWDEEAGLRAITRSRSRKEPPQLKESQAISCTSKCDATKDSLFLEMKSSVAGDPESYFLGSEEDEEVIRSRRTTLISSDYAPNDLLGGGSLQLGPSLDLGSNFTETVHIISAPNCSAGMTEMTSLSSCDHEVQYESSLDGSVIVRLRKDYLTVPRVLFTYVIGLHEHPTDVVTQFQGALLGNSFSWDEPLAGELTQQHPKGVVSNGTGLSKDPNVEYLAGSKEVSADCPDPCIDSGLREDPSVEHAGDPGKIFTDFRWRVVKYKETIGRRRDRAKKARASERPEALSQEAFISREKAMVSNDELVRRETSSDMPGVKSALDTLTEDSLISLMVSDPISPPRPIRPNPSPSTFGHNNNMNFWSEIHADSTTHMGLSRERVDLCFPIMHSIVPLEIHSPIHAWSGASHTWKTSGFSNSPHLVRSSRCLHATPARTDFNEPLLRTRKRAEIRRQSIHEGPSTPHRVPSTGSCLPDVRSTLAASNPLSTSAGLRAAYKAGTPPRKQLDASVYAKSITPLQCWDVIFHLSGLPTGICTKKFRPKAHRTIGPCDRCWTLTTPTARRSFTRLGSSLFVARTRGGCDQECVMFPECDGRSVRLCRHCFHATHAPLGVGKS